MRRRQAHELVLNGTYVLGESSTPCTEAGGDSDEKADEAEPLQRCPLGAEEDSERPRGDAAGDAQAWLLRPWQPSPWWADCIDFITVLLGLVLSCCQPQ